MEVDAKYEHRSSNLPTAGYCPGTTSWTGINIFSWSRLQQVPSGTICESIELSSYVLCV